MQALRTELDYYMHNKLVLIVELVLDSKLVLVEIQ